MYLVGLGGGVGLVLWGAFIGDVGVVVCGELVKDVVLSIKGEVGGEDLGGVVVRFEVVLEVVLEVVVGVVDVEEFC